jgi:hypothetical protein
MLVEEGILTPLAKARRLIHHFDLTFSLKGRSLRVSSLTVIYVVTKSAFLVYIILRRFHRESQLAGAI